MADLTLFALLNTSLLGVYTHKIAMDVTAHNVANASTPGYSRERPVIVSMPSLPTSTLTQPSIPLRLGMGSKVKSIQRIRDEFLDVQYRKVNNKYNFWDTLLSNVHFMEQLFGEPGKSGIRYLYDMFWSGVEEVITDPTNIAAKQELVSRAEELAKNVKDLYARLDRLRDDINNEIKQRVDKINSIIKQIADMNTQIRVGKLVKAPPNDLLDKRDLLLDELSDLVDVHYKYGDDGTIFIRIGDQLVVNGSDYRLIKALKRPYGKGYYDLFVGNSKLRINDGKLKALIDLRDKGIVKYMNRLDEFTMYLTDVFNMIHSEGFTADGVTNINFFKPIVSTSSDPAIFRIAGYRKMEGGPVKYVTGMNGVDESTIRSTPFLSDGKLVLFRNGTFSEKDISAGSTIGDLVDSGEILPDVEIKIGKHSPSTGVERSRLYLEDTSSSFNDDLVIDFDGSVLKNMGLPTTTKNFMVIDDISAALPKSGTKTYKISIEENLADGSSRWEYLTLNLNPSSTLSDVASQINSQLSRIKAHVVDFGGKKQLIIVPNKELNFDSRSFTVHDPGGFFTLSGADMKPFVVLDKRPTLENVFDLGDSGVDEQVKEKGFDVFFGETPIHIDPTTDTIWDVAKKINESGVGVNADVTPHGRLVLRGTRSRNLDLRNVPIRGPKAFFEAVGLIDSDSNPDNFKISWDSNSDSTFDEKDEMYSLISSTDSYTDIRDRLNIADFLTFDRPSVGEPIGVTKQFDVSSTVSYSPENIALDMGRVVENDDWHAAKIVPTGRANTDILMMLSKTRNKRYLDDGKVSFGEYFGSVVAEMGVEGEMANKMKVNNEILKKEIDNERERVKGVSLDEEMANMIKYQHAFNASARVLTAIDSMIGRVIDRLGVVGR